LSVIGWIVDAQVDFMDPHGRLYIKDLGDDDDPGSTLIVETLREAVAWMKQKCDLLVYTGDWHGLDDDEIDEHAPDPQSGTYPPHCMGRSHDSGERDGAWIIPEIRPDDPVVLAFDADHEAAITVARSALSQGRPVFIQKTRFDVFTGNPATESFLAAAGDELGRPMSFFVIGVARDVCVTQAVDGMQARGYAVTALSDATWGLGLEPEAVTLARWAQKGRVTTLAELRSG
jgi:nicotinamidase-related amidase